MIDISLEDGIELIKKSVSYIPKTERVLINDALGKIVGENIYSRYDNPPFNRSPIDGYACISNDLINCSKDVPVSLKVLEELNAGDDRIYEVSSGECVRIMTGAEIPDSCDCCVKQEDTDYGEEIVKVYKNIKKYGNFCFRGEDYKANELIIKEGAKLGYAEIGVIASLGINEIFVYKMPKIALISTGDEVIMPDEELQKAKIYNSNLFMISARLKELGFNDIYSCHIKDDAIDIYNKIKELYNIYDIVITTGGVSVGKKDIFHEVVTMEDIEQIFWKLKIQPGTPIMYSKYKEMPIVSLSGNPFASIVNFELIVRELIYLFYKDEKIKPKRTSAILQNDFNKKSVKRRFVRGHFENGKIYVNEEGHSSGTLSSLIGCNALIDIKEPCEFIKNGEEVEVVLT